MLVRQPRFTWVDDEERREVSPSVQVHAISRIEARMVGVAYIGILFPIIYPEKALAPILLEATRLNLISTSLSSGFRLGFFLAKCPHY